MSNSERNERPVFLVKNRIYVSAGVLPYTVEEDGTRSFLVQKILDCKWKYEDFGGKSDIGDTCIEDVAFRECAEEMNNVGPITREYLKSQLKDNRSVIYRIPDDKYMLYIIYVPIDLKNTLNLEIYGNVNDDHTTRKVEWISYKNLIETNDNDLHPRFIPVDFKNNLPLLMSHSLLGGESKYY
jgi:hypothetical protein